MANKYVVMAEMTTRLTIEVIAENDEEALEKAKEIDGGDFTEIDGGGDWRIVGANLKEENVSESFSFGLMSLTFGYDSNMVITTPYDEEKYFLNKYKCPCCGEEWEDEWSCTCNDRCPSCNKEIEPHESIELEGDTNV